MDKNIPPKGLNGVRGLRAMWKLTWTPNRKSHEFGKDTKRTEDEAFECVSPKYRFNPHTQSWTEEQGWASSFFSYHLSHRVINSRTM